MKVVLLAAGALMIAAAAYDPGPAPFRPGQVKGAWLAAVGEAPLDGPLGEAALRRLAALGATHVAFGPEVEMPDHRRPELKFGAHDEKTRAAIRAARRAGLDVFLLPRIESPSFFAPETRPGDVRPWRGDIEMTTPADWSAFFANYRRMIAHYGALAAEEDVAWLGLGLEYRLTATKHPAEWRRIARAARTSFRGKLTYSANWDDYERVTWWDAVDAIGVGAYFELLPERGQASLAEAERSWRPIKSRLKAFAERHGKPVLFTEVGYTAFADTAYRPWEWQRSDRAEDPRAQADAWRALLRTFAGEPWWSGVFVWTYYTDRSRVPSWDYAPDDREAETVLRRAFAR